ncbi:MAG: response regulator transcription factor [Betaproteobacteria bacterium]|nr:response regulator transcription factor [Betaproteobacteria bacterium]MDE2309262.1 response regulator transcription factor [Betaproteobacteria bacterium]
MIRILIADDHTVVCQGLTLILEKSHEMKIVASCSNGADALNWLRSNDCDVALIDIAMPGMNGIDLLKHLRKEKPKLPALVLSSYPEDQYAVRLIKAGAAGYLNKECAPEEVVSAVRCVLDGKRYISPAVVEMLVNELNLPDGKPPHETLSNREYQIFLLLASGKTVSEIADAVALSPKTISTYRTRVMEKMYLYNNAELMRYAIDNHLMN